MNEPGWCAGHLRDLCAFVCRTITIAVCSVILLPGSSSSKQVFTPDQYIHETDADAVGSGFAFAEYNQSVDRAYLGTYANASGLGSAAGEAVYKVGFYLPTPRQIRFRAEIYRQGAANVFGTAAFAGTYKVWHADGQRHQAEVDHWLTPERIAEICIAIAEAAAGAGEYATVAAAIRGLARDALEDNLISIFEAKLQTDEVERLVVDQTYYADAGYNEVGVGLRSQASGVLWDMGEAYSMGVVPQITVWGIGAPDPPTIDGPTVGCPSTNYTFTTFSESCEPAEQFSYQFDYGDGYVSPWIGPVYCGTPVSDTYYFPNAGTYTVTARARDLGGHEFSVASQEIDIGTYGPSASPRVYGEALSCSAVHVRWTPVPGALYYRLYRDALPPDGLVYEGSALSYDDTPPSQPSYPVYSYRVRAYNVCGFSQCAWPAYVHPNLAPDPPPDVYGVDWDSCAVILRWTPVDSAYVASTGFPGGEAATYEVWRAAIHSVTDAVQIGTTHGTYSTRFEDWPPLPNPQYYYYWIKSRNACGVSGFSESTSKSRANVPTSAPSGVSATLGDDCTKVTITWTGDPWANYVKRDGVRISGNFTDEFDDTTAQPGVLYNYTVESCPVCDLSGAKGYCQESAPVQGMRAAPTVPPAWVTASDGTHCGQVQITWSAVPNADTYAIRRNAQGIISGLTTLAYTDAPPYGGSAHPYTYTVVPHNACGDGTGRNDTGFARIAPLAPTTVGATDGTLCGTVRITWSAVGDAASYSISRNGEVLATSLTERTYDDTPPGVGSGNTYSYLVAAANTCGTGPGLSDNGYAGIGVDQQPILTAYNCGGCGDVTLVWDPIPGASLYSIYRGENDVWNLRATDILETSYTDQADASRRSHRYRYRVHAIGGCNEMQSNAVMCDVICASKDRPRQLVAGPTPFNPGTTFTFVRATTEHVRLVVYDLRGRVVRQLYDGVAAAETAVRIKWNGDTNDGGHAGTGVYIVRLQAETGPDETVKIALLR